MEEHQLLNVISCHHFSTLSLPQNMAQLERIFQSQRCVLSNFNICQLLSNSKIFGIFQNLIIIEKFLVQNITRKIYLTKKKKIRIRIIFLFKVPQNYKSYYSKFAVFLIKISCLKRNQERQLLIHFYMR